MGKMTGDKELKIVVWLSATYFTVRYQLATEQECKMAEKKIMGELTSQDWWEYTSDEGEVAWVQTKNISAVEFTIEEIKDGTDRKDK